MWTATSTSQLHSTTIRLRTCSNGRAASSTSIPTRSSDQTRRCRSTRVLVAGIGNIFLGDDGFGVEVVKHLDATSLPDGRDRRPTSEFVGCIWPTSCSMATTRWC